MKYLLLLAILFVYGCEDKKEIPYQAGEDYSASSVRCCEFDRHVIRKNEKWVCRVIFCQTSKANDNGGPTTLFCDKE